MSEGWDVTRKCRSQATVFAFATALSPGPWVIALPGNGTGIHEP